MKKEYKYHYVYRITNLVTGYHYYGSKSCNEYPTENIGKKYFSNSSVKLFIQDQKNNPQDYKYKVVKIFETCREDATELEILLHKKFDVKNHSKFINKANQTSKKFDTTGVQTQHDRVAVIDITDGKNKQVSKGEYNENANYISVKQGKVNVVDLRDGSRKQVSKEEFDTFNYYQSFLKGTVTVIDVRDNNSKQVSQKEYQNNDYYVSIKSGRMNVIDIRTGISTQVSKDDYKKFDYYVSTSSKRYRIHNKDGKLIYNVYGSFNKFCKDNNLPHQALMDSYKADGKPIFQSQYSRTKAEFKIYKGWYAVVVN